MLGEHLYVRGKNNRFWGVGMGVEVEGSLHSCWVLLLKEVDCDSISWEGKHGEASKLRTCQECMSDNVNF